MGEKTLNTRMIQKHDTTANWNKATNFVPKAGELILYTDVNGIKIGDGTTKVGSLSFIGANARDVYAWAKASTKPSYTASEVGAAESSHTHGNITNAGALQTTDVTIANGDKIVVTDASNSNKVARASASFDGSTTDSFLSKKGTFEAPPKIYTARYVSSLPSAASVPLNSIGFARSSMSTSSLLYIVRSENVVDPCTGQTYRTWNYLI